jgi:oligopeptide transport system substrate-binding protein
MENRAFSPSGGRAAGRLRGRALWPVREIVAWVAVVAVLAAPGELAQARRRPATDMSGGAIPTPVRGGTLRMVQEQASTIDPKQVADVYSGMLSMQVHRSLLIFNTNLTPVPDLARSWTISRDGLVYQVELNQNVLFHNGRELTAEDVVYTYERILKPGSNPGIAGQFLSVIAGASDYHDGRAPHITGLAVLSRYSLEIRLSRPEAAFLGTLAMTQTAIVPREVVERLGDEEFGRMPVGCGPFRLVANEPGRIVLAANENYYRTRAWLDSLLFVTPANHTTNEGTTGLLKGLFDLAEVPGFRRDEVDRNPEVRLVSRRELTLSFVGMNVGIPPFDNPHVRKAMALSVDRNAVIRMNPSGQVLATGILPPGVACYSPEVRIFPFDREEAKRELVAAGYPGGRGMPEIRYYTPRLSSRSRMADSVMVTAWQSLGIPIRRIPTDWVTLQRRLDSYELPLFSLSWIADIPDPDSFIGSLFAADSPSNYFRYMNPEVDSLMHEARITADLTKRQNIYGRIERIILNDAPMVPLYTSTSAYGIWKNVHGLELTPLGISSVDLAHVWKTSGDRADRGSSGHAGSR